MFLHLLRDGRRQAAAPDATRVDPGGLRSQQRGFVKLAREPAERTVQPVCVNALRHGGENRRRAVTLVQAEGGVDGDGEGVLPLDKRAGGEQLCDRLVLVRVGE